MIEPMRELTIDELESVSGGGGGGMGGAGGGVGDLINGSFLIFATLGLGCRSSTVQDAKIPNQLNLVTSCPFEQYHGLMQD